MDKDTKPAETIKPADVGPSPRELTVLQPPPSGLQAAPTSEAASLFLTEAKGHREAPKKISIIKIDHQSGQFVLPTGELVYEVAGYPVLYYHTRKYYKKPPRDGETGAPPDCWSADMLVPHQDSLEKQNPTCSGCPMNEFGTGRDGRSKACATPTWIFLLNPDFGDPPLSVLVAPSSSLRALTGTRWGEPGYFAAAAAKHKVYEIVWSRFALEMHGGSVQYCTLLPSMGPVADVATTKQIVQIRNACLGAMHAFRNTVVDVESEEKVA